MKSELTEAEKVLAERPQTPPSSPFNPIPVGSTGEESDAGLQGNYTAFAEVERLRNEVAELERRLPYAGISDEDLAIQVEDAAIAHEDAKVATKALENAGRPAAEAKAARLELESMRTWLALADEHQARLGTFGGMNERERWAPDVAHVESCTAPRQCRGGCRPIPDRVDMLEASFRLQASSFLVPGEQVA